VNSSHIQHRPAFLSRKTFGQPNYLLLALASAFLVALIPIGVREAIKTNTNKAEDWLPKSYSESSDLTWFRDHFVGEQFALVSWDNCTLGNTEKLDQLSRKLLPSKEALASTPVDSDLRQRALWFKRVITGPSVLAELMAPPLNLSYDEATARLEGALVGPVQRDAHGNSLGNSSRATCLIVYLNDAATRDNHGMRRAIDKISEVAVNECAILRESIHMGGPSVDNVTIDVEGGRTLMRLAGVVALVGFVLSYCCLQSAKLTALVFGCGILCAGMSLAIVFYFGVAEVALYGTGQPVLGNVDAILMTMPAVAYVLGLSGAIRLVSYYRDARRTNGLVGAVEAAIRQGWWPCTLAALMTAVGVGSLITSDIVPIKKFGLFTSIGVVASLAILFLIVPPFLYRFPLDEKHIKRQSNPRSTSPLPAWATNLFGFVINHNVATCMFWLVITGLLAVGLTRINTSVHLFELLDEKTDLISDYAWLEDHLGNIVPMELVITVPPERRRTPEEHAEQDGKQYRMTMLERLEMIREIQFRVESFPEISRALTAATFAPSNTATGVSTTADRSGDYAINKNLEEHRAALLAGDYLRMEQLPGSDLQTGRELWRVSARVAALDNPGNKIRDIDYGVFVEQLRSAVDPVLVAYQQRDMIVEALHKLGKQLDGAQLCILYRTPDNAPEPTFATQESVLANLLLKSGVQPKTLPDGKRLRGVTFYNLTDFDAHADEPQYLDTAVHALGVQDALILVSASSDPTVKKFVDGGLPIINVTNVAVADSSAAIEIAESTQPRAIRSVYTGIVPLVYKTQRQLLVSLKNSIFWATLMIAGIMMIVLRSAVAGLATMLPNVFPIIVIFGVLGWLDVKIDIGIMMCASIALGIALEGTIHFVSWFRKGIATGLSRIQAVELAYEKCTGPMVQTAIIGGLGLSVFAFSTFTPTQQFGILMVSIMSVALVGDLLILPAILAGPLGFYFGAEQTNAETEVHEKPTIPRGVQITLQHRHDRIEAPQPESAPPTPKLEFPVVTQPKIVPQHNSTTEKDSPEIAEGPHADLHARLRNLRRDAPQERMSS
jgi:predicted RND superfamily exporter protein